MRGAFAAAVLLALSACSKPDSSPPLKTSGPVRAPLKSDTRLASGAPSSNAPSIALILDDLGEQHDAGERALRLPGAVALAFLPGTPHASAQARRAHSLNKEVLLHLPLQYANGRVYPMGLSESLPRGDYTRRLRAALNTVPHARGVNNHQGSLLTQQREPMRWLMQDLAAIGGLYFVDSRTAANSVAYEIARSSGVAAGRRDVFLDAERGDAAVRAEWQRLLRYALKNGSALGIGHLYPETLGLLEQELPRLAQAGIRLVPPSELIYRQGGDRRRRTTPLKLSAAALVIPAPELPPPARQQAAVATRPAGSP